MYVIALQTMSMMVHIIQLVAVNEDRTNEDTTFGCQQVLIAFDVCFAMNPAFE